MSLKKKKTTHWSPWEAAYATLIILKIAKENVFLARTLFQVNQIADEADKS